MLRASGLSDGDFKKPLIGVANTWIEIGPCNYHLRELAHHVKEGIRAAGAVPLEFNTVSISDGITMGTEGMRTSLVSREVIADSIELVTRGNLFDALVVLVGCDKTIPGGIMALAPPEYSGLDSLRRLHRSRTIRGPLRHHSRCLRSHRQLTGAAVCPKHGSPHWKVRRAPAQARAAANSPPIPWRWSPNFSASRRWASPALRQPTKRRARQATAPAKWWSNFCAKIFCLRKIITKTSIENAIAGVAATGGSTNAVLHLLAIASEAKIPLSIDDFDRISSNVPILADLKPGGRFVATDLYAAGGTALVAKRLLEAGILRGESASPSPAAASPKKPAPPKKRRDRK